MTKSTKENIIMIAGRLFAEKGFQGTSVRDISTEAGVNLASVNYHFKNKEGLFHEVLNFNMAEVEQEIQEIAKDSENLEQFSAKLFDFFSQDSNLFLNSFKLFITNNVPCENYPLPDICKKNNFGPPGFNTMMELLDKQVGQEVPIRNREWAIRTVFKNIVQTSLINNSSFGKLLEDTVEHFSLNYKRRSIILHTQAILNFLVEHPEKFKSNV